MTNSKQIAEEIKCIVCNAPITIQFMNTPGGLLCHVKCSSKDDHLEVKYSDTEEGALEIWRKILNLPIYADTDTQ